MGRIDTRGVSEHIGLTVDENRLKDALLTKEGLGANGLTDSEHRILHLLLARERLARFEAKWSPAAREAGHYESVRTQGGHGLTSAATEGAKTESKVLREAGHCESVRTQCDPGLTAAATDGAKTEPNVHRGEPDLQVCPVDPGVPATVLQAREAGNLSPNSTQWVRKQAELRRARHLQARRKTRNAEKRASELAHPVATKLAVHRLGAALSPRSSAWVNDRAEERRMLHLEARRASRAVTAGAAKNTIVTPTLKVDIVTEEVGPPPSAHHSTNTVDLPDDDTSAVEANILVREASLSRGTNSHRSLIAEINGLELGEKNGSSLRSAAVSANEWSRGDSPSTSVTSDKEHGSRGYPSLRAEINALDFSDDVTSVTSDRIAAAISDNELARGGSAPTSVKLDRERKSSGYASLIAEINALDFSDDVISVTADRTAAAISDIESSRDGSASPSVTSDKHGSSGYASLIAEINALDFSDDDTSAILDRTAAAISDIESSRDDRAPTSVTSDEKHGSSGHASLIAEINGLDISDDVASVTSDRTDAVKSDDPPPFLTYNEALYFQWYNNEFRGRHVKLDIPCIPAFVSGTRLQYSLHEGRPLCLGAGANGAVYAAELEGIQEPVCVKVFKGKSTLTPNLDVVKEAALLSALNGTDAAPHCYGLVVLEETKGYQRLGIVQNMVTYGEPGPSNTLTLEGLLNALRSGSTRYPAPHWPTFAVQLGECLHRVHQRGVVFNDIKTDNIMLRWDGGSWCPVLVDTGLGKYRDRRMGLGPHADPEAMILQYSQCAPEIFLEDQCCDKSDVYSMGLVFEDISRFAGNEFYYLGQHCRARHLANRPDVPALQQMLKDIWMSRPWG